MALLLLSADWSYLSTILRTCLRCCKTTLRTLPVAAIVPAINSSEVAREKPEDHQVSEYKRYIADSVVRFMSGDQRTSVAYWLYGCAAGAWIAVNLNGMIMADDATLKMCDSLPYRWFPRSGNWKEDLDKFKELHPEEEGLDPSTFRIRRFHIYLHRVTNRLLTVGFLAPCMVYWLQGYFSLALRNQMFLGGCLLVSQFPLDLICRWVGSGKERIRLGQYRTTIQVMAPVLAYGTFLYNGLTMLPEPVDSSYIEDISQLRVLGKWLIGLHLGGIFVGTFTTGLDAAEPAEKHKTIMEVQEYLGYFTFLMINSTFIFGQTHNLHPQAVKALNYIMLTAYSQLGLGVLSTYLRSPSLLTLVNQNCSMGLYSFMIWFVHELRPLP